MFEAFSSRRILLRAASMAWTSLGLYEDDSGEVRKLENVARDATVAQTRAEREESQLPGQNH